MTDLEKTLLDEIRRRNVKSFELVFKSYYTRLCKYAKSMVHDYDASSDIVKDVFIHWWENCDHVLIGTSISGYLYRSVHNNCINYVNRVMKKKITVYESDLVNSLGVLMTPVSNDNPLLNMEMQELHGAIERVINSLPDQCRNVFILSRIEQKSHAEIADQLGISPNTVKVQIYRALLKLREELKDFMPFLLFLFGQQIFRN
jgi:RNA polymerase sigma-70 factor, ECF subfamily